MTEVSRLARHRRSNPRRQPTDEMIERTEELGKQITQWRKAHAQTVMSSRSAPTMYLNAQEENVALRARVAELESDNALMAEELASIREYEEEMEVESTGAASEDEEFSGFSDGEPMETSDAGAASEDEPSSSSSDSSSTSGDSSSGESSDGILTLSSGVIRVRSDVGEVEEGLRAPRNSPVGL